MARSTVHYADNKTNNALKKLHNKLRPAGTPVQRVEYIIELLLLRIFETKIKQDDEFKPLRKLFTADYRWKNPKTGKEESNENRLFSYLPTVSNEQILSELNDNFFPFYSTILQSARQVFAGNLPQKVQDQLVLIEEVFGNSNFTNNVNSGNLGEVISVVAHDIEEARLLKTDLLGDAIESALSETGGTKEIGLFRTPDHVRQFMTALVEPDFDDIVFDPACGTGGFLFDTFEFVMRRVDPARDWPGEKSHSELRSWFNGYFENHPLEFPSIEQTSQFYRTGVAGIEYLGMIRKMAAINFYIRGLNPDNIQQGDSLAKYNPVTDAGSKTVVIANPPFGAERDQEAYPEVWGEYPKESETTILFVKLMFDLLHEGGRCAVIVSEGFHTWDQNSAKALRKMILDEARLKAIISLPQGLFVSKGGQGPKTSILLYEKGGKTDWVWFYKVTNDGYTLGTNRKEQKGNQLVECLELYHKYVKHGNRPPESKHQFCIPAGWIKALDPRIKEKIRTETRADLEAKGEIDRKKKDEDLDKKIDSGKITEAEKQIDLKLFDQMLENRIQNETAKRIDKAFTYSFNLPNYRSNLTESQISELKESLKNVKSDGPKSLDDIYRKLSQTDPKTALSYLVKLNPANALEADIGREYVSALDENVLSKHKELSAIRKILRSKVIYPIEKLEGKIEPKFIKIKKDDYDGEIDIIEKISFADGKVHLRDENVTGMDLYLVEKGDLITSKINIHQGAVALAERKLVCSTHYQAYEIDSSQVLPEYLVSILRSKQFQNRVIEVKNNGIKNEQGANFFKSQHIPLPNIEVQVEIANQIKKQKEIVEGAKKILENIQLTVPDSAFESSNKIKLGDKQFFKIIGGGTPSKINPDYWNGNIPWVSPKDMKSFDINESEDRITDYAIKESSTNLVPAKSVLIVVRSGILKHTLPVGINTIPVTINQDLKAIIPIQYFEPEFIAYHLLLNQQSILNKVRNGPTVEGLSMEIINSFDIPKIDIEDQRIIIKELNSQMSIFENLRRIINEAEKKIEIILFDVWGM